MTARVRNAMAGAGVVLARLVNGEAQSKPTASAPPLRNALKTRRSCRWGEGAFGRAHFAGNVVLTRRTQVIELVRTVAVLIRIAGCARGDVAYGLFVDEQKAKHHRAVGVLVSLPVRVERAVTRVVCGDRVERRDIATESDSALARVGKVEAGRVLAQRVKVVRADPVPDKAYFVLAAVLEHVQPSGKPSRLDPELSLGRI
eukprot:429104-Prymnesium_polylepis.1